MNHGNHNNQINPSNPSNKIRELTVTGMDGQGHRLLIRLRMNPVLLLMSPNTRPISFLMISSSGLLVIFPDHRSFIRLRMSPRSDLNIPRSGFSVTFSRASSLILYIHKNSFWRLTLYGYHPSLSIHLSPQSVWWLFTNVMWLSYCAARTFGVFTFKMGFPRCSLGVKRIGRSRGWSREGRVGIEIFGWSGEGRVGN